MSLDRVLVGNGERWRVERRRTLRGKKNLDLALHQSPTTSYIQFGEGVYLRSNSGYYLTVSGRGGGELILEEDPSSLSLFQIFSMASPSYPPWERERPFLTSPNNLFLFVDI